jgi:hypothetical protein
VDYGMTVSCYQPGPGGDACGPAMHACSVSRDSLRRGPSIPRAIAPESSGELRGQGDLLHARRVRGCRRGGRPSSAASRLQPLDWKGAGPASRHLPVLRHRFRGHRRARWGKVFGAGGTRRCRGSGVASRRGARYIVCTGGEPALQLDAPLVKRAA